MTGSELKKIRESLRLTQEEFADRLGVARNTVARWERNEISIPRYLNLAVPEIASDKSLADYLNRVITEERLTHIEIAKRAQKRGFKISAGYVHNVSRGLITNPSVDLLKALASGLGRPEGEVFKAAGVKTGESVAEIEVSRFAEMARSYAGLSGHDKRALEIFIAALERAIREASDR